MDNGHADGHQHEGQALEVLTEPPSLIVDAPGLRVWHKLDRTFRWEPQSTSPCQHAPPPCGLASVPPVARLQQPLGVHA